MNIELKDAVRERLIILISEKNRIDQRINDVISTIADLHKIDKDAPLSINSDCTELIVGENEN
jgi:chaperonin cofactor prefoldin